MPVQPNAGFTAPNSSKCREFPGHSSTNTIRVFERLLDVSSGGFAELASQFT
jgi:hypothetical protein